MSKLLVTITVLFIIFSSAAEASSNSQEYRSYLDNISCGQIVDGLDKEATRKAYVLMIGSFISGSNYAKNRDSKTELKGMLMLTEQFCRQNPEFPIMTALIYLDKSIDKKLNRTQ